MKPLAIILFSCWQTVALTQISFNDFAQFYPIGEDPNIRYMTSYQKQETILFEANPIIRFGVYNNFMKGLMNNTKHTEAWYLSFKPQLRMYTENSLPVKTPSYKILIGTQHLFRLPNEKLPEYSQHFWGFSIESGHYSNGQNGCSFSRDFEIGTPECDSIYRLINSGTDLSEILNRNSGNFSTNLTELILNYRIYKLDDNNAPKKMHSINLGYLLYHDFFFGIANFGGYSDEDIQIYGRHRYLFNYEYMRVFKNGEGSRISFKQNIELIQGAHSHVTPIRSESIFTYYPFLKSKTIGFFASYIYGHDNYNYRFVDSGHQGSIGITWNQFPPFTLTNEL